MPPVRIPAAAANRLALPVCVRHGRPAGSRPPMVFAARPPAWTLLLLLFGGGLVYLIVANHVRKEVFAQAWPWCGRCGLTRLWRAALGLAVLATGGWLALTYSESVRGPLALVVIAVTASLMITGWVVLTRATRAASAGVRVSRDGEWLELPRAHERFAAALREQPAPVYPMSPGWTVPVTAAPSEAWAATADPLPVPAGTPDPTAPVAPAPSHGWTSPSL